MTQYVYNGDGARVKKVVGSTATYYIGNWYEVTNGAITKYYYFGSQRVAMKTASGVTYLHGDHLGSTSVTSGAQPGSQTYYPYGTVRSGTLPTDYTFTGQKLDNSDSLLFYNARYYDAAIGRFTQPDSIIPNPYNPQALNRYAYVYNNPLRYTDPTGHCPLCIVAAIVILKAIDYGWTAYDIYDSGNTIANPRASIEDKVIAGANIALSVGLEAAEPDDLLPVGVPLDDVARKGILAGVRTAINEGGVNAGLRVIKSKLGGDAIRALYDQGVFKGIRSFKEWDEILAGVRSGAGLEVHHLIEQRFAGEFRLKAGDIPSAVLTKEQHDIFTGKWQQRIGYDNWDVALKTSNATLDDIWDAAQDIYKDFPEFLDAVKQALGK